MPRLISCLACTGKRPQRPKDVEKWRNTASYQLGWRRDWPGRCDLYCTMAGPLDCTAKAIPFIYSFSGNCAASAPISTFIYFLQQKRQTHCGNTSFTDTRMWKLGLRPRYSFSGNICYKFSAFCLCSAPALTGAAQLRVSGNFSCCCSWYIAKSKQQAVITEIIHLRTGHYSSRDPCLLHGIRL